MRGFKPVLMKFVLALSLVVSFFTFEASAFAATVGSPLTQPEQGWKRYNYDHSLINYTGTWAISSLAKYNNSNVITDNISFKFYGTKLRVISTKWQNSYSDNIEISIDGVKESYSQIGAEGSNILLYEKTGLKDGHHVVQIKRPSARTYFSLQAVDVDSTGYLANDNGPDEGWRRYDNTFNTIDYKGGWSRYSSNSYHGGSELESSSGNGTDSIEFKFYGSKLRLFSQTAATGYSENIEIQIDGASENYSQKGSGSKYQQQVYEKTGLVYGFHSVIIKRVSGDKAFSLDALDIDVTGYLTNDDAPVLPNAPTNLVAVANNTNKQITLNWDTVTGATYYKVSRSDTQGGQFKAIGAAEEGTFSDKEAAPGVVYYYVVTSVAATGESVKSNEVSAMLEVPATRLDIDSVSDKVYLNDIFTVQVDLKNATNIYAEDFSVQYDTTRFQFVGIEEVGHIAVLSNTSTANDTIRLITVSKGKDYGVTGDATLVKLKFKAIGLGKGKVDATKGKIADNGNMELTLAEDKVGEKIIDVIARTEFTLKDIGSLGYNYTDSKSNLNNDLKGLLGETGNVENVDLLTLVDAVLANPNYDFNH